MSELTQLINLMQLQGAQRFFIKPLANNDNSKNQIYLGSNFEVIQALPTGEVKAAGIKSKGAIFKAALSFSWINLAGVTDEAPNAQIIFYPGYPEIRLSGFLARTSKQKAVAPSHLMQPPTPEERKQRDEHQQQRYLILGFNKTNLWAFCTDWTSQLTQEVKAIIQNLELVASVFYEYRSSTLSSEAKLISLLKNIYNQGAIESCRLNNQGQKIAYKAQNGAGYTLEAEFGITPNDSPDPDFMEWELKAHSRGAVTLMTPEPTRGSYLQDLETFLRAYGTRKEEHRLDFASRHLVGQLNNKTNLTLYLEGYDFVVNKITDPEGGLMLRDRQGQLAAGWSFEKLISHWKNKHTNTCYVSYTKHQGQLPLYHFGPSITLAKGTDLQLFLQALYNTSIYYDPGINMKYQDGHWKSKKRNQFRVSWGKVGELYSQLEEIDLSK